MGADFVTLGYFAGEIITPWLHKLDQHLKHFIWLAAAIVFGIVLRFVIRRWNRRRAG